MKAQAAPNAAAAIRAMGSSRAKGRVPSRHLHLQRTWVGIEGRDDFGHEGAGFGGVETHLHAGVFERLHLRGRGALAGGADHVDLAHRVLWIARRGEEPSCPVESLLAARSGAHGWQFLQQEPLDVVGAVRRLAGEHGLRGCAVPRKRPASNPGIPGIQSLPMAKAILRSL